MSKYSLSIGFRVKSHISHKYLHPFDFPITEQHITHRTHTFHNHAPHPAQLLSHVNVFFAGHSFYCFSPSTANTIDWRIPCAQRFVWKIARTHDGRETVRTDAHKQSH